MTSPDSRVQSPVAMTSSDSHVAMTSHVTMTTVAMRVCYCKECLEDRARAKRLPFTGEDVFYTGPPTNNHTGPPAATNNHNNSTPDRYHNGTNSPKISVKSPSMINLNHHHNPFARINSNRSSSHNWSKKQNSFHNPTSPTRTKGHNHTSPPRNQTSPLSSNHHTSPTHRNGNHSNHGNHGNILASPLPARKWDPPWETRPNPRFAGDWSPPPPPRPRPSPSYNRRRTTGSMRVPGSKSNRAGGGGISALSNVSEGSRPGFGRLPSYNERHSYSRTIGLHDDIKMSWKDREQKLNKGLELRKFEQGIKNLYLWISEDGESFIRSHSLFSTTANNLTAMFAEFNNFQRQIAHEQSRLMELEMACTSLKECIIFDNGAIDNRMNAARQAWDVFNAKFGLRRKLLQILVDVVIPPFDKVRSEEGVVCMSMSVW
eukprot:sb/3464903/